MFSMTPHKAVQILVIIFYTEHTNTQVKMMTLTITSYGLIFSIFLVFEVRWP